MITATEEQTENWSDYSSCSDISSSYLLRSATVFEGENDGLLTPDSVKWGNFRGVYQGAGRRGISHCDEIDMRRRPLVLKTGDRTLDILEFYTEIVSELANKGY